MGRSSKRNLGHHFWFVVWNISIIFSTYIYILILGRIIPTDFLIFFRGVGQPPSCPTDWIILDSKAGPLPWADQDPVASLLPRWRWAEEGFSKSPFDLDDDDSGTVGTMGKPWENHRKTIGKWWFNGIYWDFILW